MRGTSILLAPHQPGKITDLAARPQHESGDPHPRFDAPPESLGMTARFHRRGVYAHAAPRSLGSISRASMPLRALSTRKTPAEVKSELGRVRASTQAFAAPCSDRHLQVAQPARFCLAFVFSLRTRGAKSIFFVRVAAKRASQPRVKFGASAGALLTRRTATRA